MNYLKFLKLKSEINIEIRETILEDVRFKNHD